VDFKFINPGYLETVTGGDKDIIQELVDMFRQQTFEVTNEMKSLLANKEYFTLGLLAHKAKSSVAIIGMAELAAMLKTFELDAKAGKDTGMYATYIARFESETRSAIEELEKYVSNL
jgi:HPt (histidine-containing phosphotransfer) domain-containing protein